MDSRHALGLIAFCSLVMLAASAIAGGTGGTGGIEGVVYDLLSGEKLISANVGLVGTPMGAVADLTGSFRIHDVPAGRYNLRVSYMGYVTKVMEGVDVAENAVTRLDVSLAPVAIKANEVVISAKKVRSSLEGMLAERRRSATISDVISAEEISHSADATSGDALKRVTGITIVDDKFVYIRGVTDRYNGTSLNGTRVTGTDTDADKKSFCFDMLPADLLENAVIIKTATPDRPGDFSGGVVELNTRSFPSQRRLGVSVSSAYNTATSMQTVFGPRRGRYDWLGFDDGGRAFPGGNLGGYRLAQALPNDWTSRTSRAPLNRSFSLSAGDRIAPGGQEIGMVVGLSYKTGRELIKFAERPTYLGEPIFSFEGKRSKYSVLWGGILGLSYEPSGLHKFRLDADLSQVAEDVVSKSAGIPISGQFTDRQTIEWDQRSFGLVQLGGQHRVPSLLNIGIDWRTFISRSSADEPDRKHVEYEFGSSQVSYMKENYRTWSSLDEHSSGGATDVVVPVGQGKTKCGFAWETRARNFDIKAFSTDVAAVTPANYGLLVLPLESIFGAENYGPGKFNLIPITPFTGRYGAEHGIKAYYAMFDQPFSLAHIRWRLVAGARIEDSNQQIHTVKAIDDPTPFTARIRKSDVLPSVNLTCPLGSRANIRVAYSHTVNRPEFREMANVLYYDFNRTQNVLGNPRLKRALVRNYDARFEVYQGTGEMAAVSFFYKNITDAIEERLVPSPERYLMTWFNSPQGTNYGYEVDLKQSLGFAGRHLSDLTVSGNYTRISSFIEYTDKHTAPNGAPIITQKTRPMQGQAPWTANLGLAYARMSTGTAINVMFNRIGRRLAAVGDTREEDVYQEPRSQVDLAVTQKLPAGFSAKLAGKDIMGHDEIRTSGPRRELHSRYSNGRSYSLSVSVDL